MTFTLVYDNYPLVAGLRTAWGLACWVDTGEAQVLLDTGGDAPTLLGNLAKLGLDPKTLDAVVLSHIHNDHVGGLAGLLDAGARPTVYALDSFPASFLAQIGARTKVVPVSGHMAIAPGVHTTGPVRGSVIEQALVAETAEGLVVVTGCAHPGIVAMVRQAKATVPGEVALALGGYHLGSASQATVKGIIADLRDLGVRQVAPCHCTGDAARAAFAAAYQGDCHLSGVGWTYRVKAGH